MHTAPLALTAFDFAALLVVAAAALGWFNHHFLKLHVAAECFQFSGDVLDCFCRLCRST